LELRDGRLKEAGLREGVPELRSADGRRTRG